MIASAIIETLRDAGLILSLTDKSGVKVAPAGRLTDKLRGLIRSHKAELVDWLAAANDPSPTEPQAPDLTGWNVALAPGLPAATVAEFKAASQALDRLIAQAGERAGPDRDCWPHSDAMNGAEIDAFTARLARFTDKGLGLADAERLADRLVIRDRESDDRRLCLECMHLHRGGRCGNWQRAGVAMTARDARLPGELVQRLQRCDGFMATL
ncbi:MAG TPA: hypothetical protein VN617_11825 [Rhodoferax sp.]|nr:hypothetical protein [Rhodoferax sp.]